MKSISVQSLRGRDLYQHTPVHSPHLEPLHWLHSLEGGGRYQHDLQMKQNEGESIHPNTTIRENYQVKRRRSQTYIFFKGALVYFLKGPELYQHAHTLCPLSPPLSHLSLSLYAGSTL